MVKNWFAGAFVAVPALVGLSASASAQGLGFEVRVAPRYGQYSTDSELGPAWSGEPWAASARLVRSRAVGLGLEVRPDGIPLGVRGLVEYAPESSIHLYGPGSGDPLPNPARVTTLVADLVLRPEIPGMLQPFAAVGIGTKSYALSRPAVSESRPVGTFFEPGALWPSEYSARTTHFAAGVEVDLGRFRTSLEYGVYRSRYVVREASWSFRSYDPEPKDVLADVSPIDRFLTLGLSFAAF